MLIYVWCVAKEIIYTHYRVYLQFDTEFMKFYVFLFQVYLTYFQTFQYYENKNFIFTNWAL